MNILNKLVVLLFGALFPAFTFSQTSLSWVEKNESTDYVARHEFGFVQAGDKFIMFGGREWPERLDVYDYTTNTWSRGGDAPVDFNHVQAVYHKGLVWVIGAFKDNAFPNEEPVDYIYMYNPATEQWIQGMEIPESRKRGAGALVVYNDKFYVVGGNNQGHNGGFVPYFDEFNPATGEWTQLNDAPHARDHFHSVVYNDKLYALGGRLSGGSSPAVPEVDVYNFNTSSWTTLNASSNIPTPRSGVGVVLFEDEIFVIGGEGEELYDTVEAFDPMTNTWSTKNSLNNARHGIQAIVSNNTIYVAGGAGNFVSLRDMEYYGVSDNPAGNASVSSIFSADEDTKVFTYTESDGQVTIDITLSNTLGTTGTYIDDIEITGNNYSIIGNYQNILLDSNEDLSFEVLLSDTSQLQSLGNVQVTYNNNATLNIGLEGTQDNTMSLDENNYKNIKIFPSVVTSNFYLNKRVNSLNIYTISGKRVTSFKGDFASNVWFDISSLSNGLYFVEVENNLGTKSVLKIIKK